MNIAVDEAYGRRIFSTEGVNSQVPGCRWEPYVDTSLENPTKRVPKVHGEATPLISQAKGQSFKRK